MTPGTDYTPPPPGQRPGHVPRSCLPAAHSSRRVIDMAMGAYMAIRHCPEQQARAAIIDAARDSGVGLGAASQALMAVINGEFGADATGAVDYWRRHLQTGV